MYQLRRRARSARSVWWLVPAAALAVIAALGMARVSAADDATHAIREGVRSFVEQARRLGAVPGALDDVPLNVLHDPVPLTAVDPTGPEGLAVDEVLRQLATAIGALSDTSPEALRAGLEALDRTVAGVRVDVGLRLL